MNHPTNEVDELLLYARQAMAADDGESAVECLRRASKLAPMRKDVRAMLANALSGRSASSFSSSSIAGTPSSSGSVFSGKRISDRGTATASPAKRLTTMLGQGLRSWKSSFSTALQPDRPAPVAAASSTVSPKPQPAQETTSLLDDAVSSYLDEYAANPESDYVTPQQGMENGRFSRYSFDDQDAAEAEPEIAGTVEPEPIREKKVKAPVRKPSGRSLSKTHKSSDMEDLLAAGIDSLMENLAGVSRKRYAYAGACVLMIALVIAACIKTSRAFPEVPVLSVPFAPTSRVSSDGKNPSNPDRLILNPLDSGRELARAGKIDEAVNVLEGALASGDSSLDVAGIQAELSGVLDSRATAELKNNKLVESARDYRRASELNAKNPELVLHLGNALYYCGTMMKSSDAGTYLSEAVTKLEKAVSMAPKNIHAHRMLALALMAHQDESRARAEWRNVKKLASPGSAFDKEADESLKKLK